MKKLLSLVLALTLLLSLGCASAEETLSGGWTSLKVEGELPEDAVNALLNADNADGYGCTLVPLAVLATQVVNGTNYIILCEGRYEEEGKVPDYLVATVYCDPTGYSTITMTGGTELNYVEEVWEDIDLGYETEQSEDDTIVTVRIPQEEAFGENWNVYVSDEKILEPLLDGVDGDVYAASFIVPEEAVKGTAYVVLSSKTTDEYGDPIAKFSMLVEVDGDGKLFISESSYTKTDVSSAEEAEPEA